MILFYLWENLNLLQQKICQIYCKRKYGVDIVDIVTDALLESISDMIAFSVFFLKIHLNRISRCNNTQTPSDRNRIRRFGKGNERKR